MKSEREMPRRRTIWKFPLSEETQTIQMPMDAEVAHFDYQNGIPCIWAIIDPDVMMVPRTFAIFGTSHQVPGLAEGCYVGTSQQGQFVWHLFELL